jgi:hypothetical protein
VPGGEPVGAQRLQPAQPAGRRTLRGGWRAVLVNAAERVLDIAFEHATIGEEVPIFDQDGVRTGSTRRYNTRMAMFVLRAYFPERFRHANRDTRPAADPLPAAAAPVPAVVEALAPITPAEPHRLAPPDQLADMVAVADILAGDDGQPDGPEAYRVPPREEQPARVAARARIRKAGRAMAEEAAAQRAGLWEEPVKGGVIAPDPDDPDDWQHFVSSLNLP